jgi:hypothetical protein
MQAVAYQRRISGRPQARRFGTRRARALYPSLAAFYNAERRRLSSRELDVGLWWRDGSEGSVCRAAWVQETGELYTVRLGAPEDGGGRVEVLGVFPDRQRLERALAGWRGHCGEPSSLGWLRGRARTPVQVSPAAA